MTRRARGPRPRPRPAGAGVALLLGLLLPVAARADLPVDLTLRNVLPEARTGVPVTWGVPFAPADALLDPASLTLLHGSTSVPFQATVLARWGGAPSDATRPVAWLLLDLAADLPPSGALALRLVRTPRADPSSPLRVAKNDASEVVVETGAATYTMSKSAFRLFDRVVLSAGTTFAGTGGISYRGSPVAGPVTVDVPVSGRERITVRVKGTVQGDLGYTLLLHFRKGLAEVRLDFRLENLSAYAWRDGQPDCNSYGSPGSVSFDDLTLVFPSGGAKDYRYPGGENGSGADVTGTYGTALSLVQESSGDARWDALRSEAPRLQSGVAKRASTVTRDGSSADGPNQLGGWLDAGGVTVAVADVWQSFPKALRARDGALEAGLFPGEYSRDHELRAGEFKTHTVWVRHHAAGAADVGARARSALSPARLQAPAEAAARSGAAGLFAPRLQETFPDYENGVDWQVVESPHYADAPWESTAPHLLEAISIAQHYGWVDHGDVPTDFEPFDGGGVLSSPWNLKYDTLRGMLQQALRTGDETWWRLGTAGARHAADVDLLHSRNRGRTGARAWPDGGMYGHGYHDERGNVNPHRNFMNPSVSMTGPPPGMFLHAFLTGDLLVLDSALEAADAVFWRAVSSAYPDDGGCAASSGLRRCSEACEGYEEADGSRTGAHVVKTMVSAYLATGERDYLDVASSVAKYVDCVEARTGVCCNRHNIQTTFDGAVGQYLAFRSAAGLGDDAAARSVLRRRVDYVVQRLFDPAAGNLRMCYLCEADPDWDDCDESVMCPYDDNWLFSGADSVALSSVALSDPSLLTAVARPLFETGARHPMGGTSTLAYHATKELANQVGFGGGFLWAFWNRSGSGTTCTSDGQTLCLNGSRFQVRATWRDYSGASGPAQAVPLTNDTGYFWFFGRDNVEVVVKALDFCAVNGRWAVYAAGLTDVGIGLTVTDTRSGVTKSYANDLGVPFVLVRDAPFACP